MSRRSTTLSKPDAAKIALRYYNQHHKYLDKDQLCMCVACSEYRQLTKGMTNDNPRTDV